MKYTFASNFNLRQMNKNEEDKYYASMVRKFRTEYNSKNLHRFCKEKKVSYIKKLYCLRDISYRKSRIKPVASEAEEGLHSLMVDMPALVAIDLSIFSRVSLLDILLDNIGVKFGTKVSLHIGNCSKVALISLIKEMEGGIC